MQPQNIQWLAEHYYFLANTKELDASKRAILLFEYLLEGNPDQQELALHRLSSLLSYTTELNKKINLLEHWTQKEPQTQIQKHLLLELANTYNAIGEKNKAFALYDTLSRCCATSYIGFIALTERCKIAFSNLPENEKTENNPACIEILNHLKDIENERNISLEPLHIEAGLIYIQCKTSLIEYENKKSIKKKELLQLLLDNIALYSLDPSFTKNTTLETYSIFINNEILLEEGNTLQQEQASLALKELLDQPLLANPLYIRIQQRIQELSPLP